MGRTEKVINVGKISDKDEILKVEDKQLYLIGNKTKGSLEMNPWKRELETRRSKAANMRIEKRIEKEK